MVFDVVWFGVRCAVVVYALLLVVVWYTMVFDVVWFGVFCGVSNHGV